MTIDLRELAKELRGVILETVEEWGDEGVPSSLIYIAFSEHGVPLDFYLHLLSSLERDGEIEVRSHRVYRVRRRNS